MSTTTPDGPTDDEQQLNEAALRRILYGMADREPVPGESLVPVAAEAEERMNDIEQRPTELEARVETVEKRAPSPSDQTYARMDKSAKATVVRSKLRDEAEGTTGKASMKYRDVIRVFDGKPSPGHAYDIMDTAAEGDGFDLGTDGDGEKRLTFNARRCE